MDGETIRKILIHVGKDPDPPKIYESTLEKRNFLSNPNSQPSFTQILKNGALNGRKVMVFVLEDL